MHISKAVLASALALTVAAAPLQGSQGTGGTDSAIVLNLCAELESCACASSPPPPRPNPPSHTASLNFDPSFLSSPADGS